MSSLIESEYKKYVKIIGVESFFACESVCFGEYMRWKSTDAIKPTPVEHITTVFVAKPTRERRS